MSTFKKSFIWFSVSVPVLSVHKTFMLPKVSIAESRFTMTPFLDIAMAPLERLMVMIMGRSSGVNPTANATAKSSAVNYAVWCRVAKRNVS